MIWNSVCRALFGRRRSGEDATVTTVDVIYHHYPHYRAPVMRCLASSERFRYRFWGSTHEVNGIVPFAGDEVVKIHNLDFSVGRRFWYLKGYMKPLFSRTSAAVIVIANPNMPATWLIGILGRLLGKKILFWTHGWLRKEKPAARIIRNFYLSLADKVLVYGNRARDIAGESGFPVDKIAVIYNSLDYENSKQIRERVEAGLLVSVRPQELFTDQNRPLLICTARLIRECRFDILLDACSLMQQKNFPVNVLLVGDGPERGELERQAERLGLSVKFYGACYNEEILGQLIYHSDLTVSPGKIGLTVIHSLTYGTPAITHGNLDAQMPEVEAILDGKTGLFFKQGDPDDLSNVIIHWLRSGYDRSGVRGDCYDVIEKCWNPNMQRDRIDAAVASVV